MSSAPPQPGGGGPEQQVLKSEEPVPSTSQSTPEVQEQISEASNTDSDGADEPPPEREPPRRTLKVRLPLKLLKHGHQTTVSGSKDGVTPSKVHKEPEAKEAEVGTPTGPSEAALQKGPPSSPGGSCPDPQTQGGRSDHPTGSRLFPHFPFKAGDR